MELHTHPHTHSHTHAHTLTHRASTGETRRSRSAWQPIQLCSISSQHLALRQGPIPLAALAAAAAGSNSGARKGVVYTGKSDAHEQCHTILGGGTAPLAPPLPRTELPFRGPSVLLSCRGAQGGAAPPRQHWRPPGCLVLPQGVGARVCLTTGFACAQCGSQEGTHMSCCCSAAAIGWHVALLAAILLLRVYWSDRPLDFLQQCKHSLHVLDQPVVDNHHKIQTSLRASCAIRSKQCFSVIPLAYKHQ